MPSADHSFVILKQVDSTNNYAMAQVHAGMAKHADAYFCSVQTAGKGQRGKQWQTGNKLNIALSIILNPQHLKINLPFQLSVATALACVGFFSDLAGVDISVKWPNDIYWRDRKAGGILIENIYKGKQWTWSVAGIGFNINQTEFDERLINPVSLKQITGEDFELLPLAKSLHQYIMTKTAELITRPFDELMQEYNRHLYKIHSLVKLKKNDIVFETYIKGVSHTGQLHTVDSSEKHFNFGEVEWLL